MRSEKLHRSFLGVVLMDIRMNVQPQLRMDKTAFAAWIETVQEHYELVAGCAVMMPRPSRAHGILVMNLAALLRARLDRRQRTVIAEFGLDVGPQTLRYPDILVDRAGGRSTDYTATAPVLLAEVLSPSSADVDLGDKVAEYLRIPSLLAYIVLSQDAAKAWVYARAAAGFGPGPAQICGIDGVIAIAPLQLELPLADIYADVLDVEPPNSRNTVLPRTTWRA